MSSTRSSSWEELALTSKAIARDAADGVRVELSIVATGDESWQPVASAVATMQRPRQAEHEVLWAQLFVDGVFVDVVRALEIGSEDPVPVFLARFRVPPAHFDGRMHVARVRFVPAISHAVPRGVGQQLSAVETAPPIDVEAEFVAALSPARARRALR